MQPAEVLRMAESVRRDVEAGCLFRKDEQKAPVTITISLGVSLASEADSSDGFYRDADLALYSAKNGGRNCVRKYDSRMSGNSANGRMMYRDEG
jgi:diguanylate cyclase